MHDVHACRASCLPPSRQFVCPPLYAYMTHHMIVFLPPTCKSDSLHVFLPASFLPACVSVCLCSCLFICSCLCFCLSAWLCSCFSMFFPSTVPVYLCSFCMSGFLFSYVPVCQSACLPVFLVSVTEKLVPMFSIHSL